MSGAFSNHQANQNLGPPSGDPFGFVRHAEMRTRPRNLRLNPLRNLESAVVPALELRSAVARRFGTPEAPSFPLWSLTTRGSGQLRGLPRGGAGQLRGLSRSCRGGSRLITRGPRRLRACHEGAAATSTLITRGPRRLRGLSQGGCSDFEACHEMLAPASRPSRSGVRHIGVSRMVDGASEVERALGGPSRGHPNLRID